jgi:hypothetical protein
MPEGEMTDNKANKVKFSSDPARMAESRAREKAERRRRSRGKEALAISVAAGIRTPKCDDPD